MAKNTENYENNPFNIGLTGLRLLFDNAKNIAILAIILSAVAFLGNLASTANDITTTFTQSEAEIAKQERSDEQAMQHFFAQDPGVIAVTGILIASAIFLFIVVSLWIYGAFEYTGAKLAKGQKVGLKEAFKEVGKDLASYVWLWVIIFVKVLLWSLLFIIPGIIMAVRYSLAGTAFFAEGKRGNDAVKRSLDLTRGAWVTTFAGLALWNFITFGMISYLLQPGINAVLYRQFAPLTDAKQPKPATHWLSWVTLVGPITLLAFLVFIGLLIALLVTLATR